MADTGSNGMDYPAHQQTFGGFANLMKWGTLASIIAAAFVVFLIAK